MQRLSTWRVGQSYVQHGLLPIRLLNPCNFHLRHLSSTFKRCSKDGSSRDEKPEYEINYYEQSTPSRSSIRPISQDEFEETDVGDRIKARIKDLQAQLQIIESGKSFDELSAEEREIVSKVGEDDSFTAQNFDETQGDDDGSDIAASAGQDVRPRDLELTPDEVREIEEEEGGKEAIETLRELKELSETSQVMIGDSIRGGNLSQEQMLKLLNEDSEEAENLLRQLPPQERRIVERARSGEELSEVEVTQLLGGDGTPNGADMFGLGSDELELDNIEFELPAEHQRNLEKLTELLRSVSENPTSVRERRSLWQQYTLCKSQLPGFQAQFPKQAWNILWQSQYVIDPDSEARSRHLWELTEDMSRCQQPLSPEQQMVRIEGRVADRKYKEALKMWKDSRAELENNEDVAEAFCDLGPSILASLQRPSDAQALALELAPSAPRLSTFIPVIQAWLEQRSKSGSGKAWALYLKIRELVKERITPDDYDLLVMTFFRGGQVPLALAIFKDLVVAGRKSGHDTLELRNRYSGVYKQLQEQSQDVESVNSVSLASLTALPREFQNKFFYAMWMKRLIGMREIEAAASVLELMYLRGVQADPRHINGLISALIRRNRPGDKSSGRLSDKDLALETAWSMVQERLNFVTRRRAVESGEPPPPVPDDPSRHLPPYLGKNLPPATIETFSIILLYYTRANMSASVEKVNTFLVYAELQPNIYYLNHLLYNQLRRGDRSAVWNLYLKATQPQTLLPHSPTLAPPSPRTPRPSALTPDLSTFSCLWEAEKAHVMANPSMRRSLFDRSGVHFPGPRSLFGHMTRWLSSLSQKQRDEAVGEFSHDLYTTIIRSFCLTKDMLGTLIALYALRDIFGHFPDADDVRIVSIQLARGSEPHLGGWKKRRVGRLGDKKGSQVQLGRVSELLGIVKKEREDALAGMGVKRDELGEREQGEESLWMLAGLIKSVTEGMKSEGGLRTGAEQKGVEGTDELDDDIEKVAWKMSVGGLTLGAPKYKKGWMGGTQMAGYEGQPLPEIPEKEGWEGLD
ncbi:MAG: hypothetical protein MMC23_006736 [Stictis urceolatum]|nr:hypothetical protein [Stictis urceolata]